MITYRITSTRRDLPEMLGYVLGAALMYCRSGAANISG
jgi:hypothetical protein